MDGYKLPILFFHESVYDLAGKEAETQNYGYANKLFLLSSLTNKILVAYSNEYVTFTTDKTLNIVKSKDYASHFTGFVRLGKDIAYPEPHIEHSDMLKGFVKTANEKDSDVVSEIKIIADGTTNIQNLKKFIDESHYKIDVISVEDSIKIIEYLHNYIKEYVKKNRP